MNRKELLRKYFDMEMDVVFHNSFDYRMNCPQKGCEHEWREAKERVGILEEMIGEYNG